MSAALLDDIIGRHAAPVVVHEDHDIRNINWVNGLSDPGEMISCGYMPEMRRQSGEQDAEYAIRIRPIVTALPQDQQDIIMGAAIKRAGYDTSNGRVNAAFVGKLPWTGLGVTLSGIVRSADMLHHSGTAFTVDKRPLYYGDTAKVETNTKYAQDPGSFALVRTDTNERLGSCGGGYQVIQNEEAFSLLDNLISAEGATYESAGSLRGGRTVWLLAHMPKHGFTINGGDRVEPYMAFFNGHTGRSGRAWCYPTTVRIECNNTLNVSARKDKMKGIGFTHRGSIKNKIESARTALGFSVRRFGVFKEQAEALYAKKGMNIQHYADGVLDVVLKVTAAQALAGADALAAAIAETEALQDMDALVRKCQRDIEGRGDILQDIIERHDSDRCKNIRGTGWGVFNALTEHADHNTLGKYHKKEPLAEQSRRFESTLLGAANEMKQVALEHALAV